MVKKMLLSFIGMLLLLGMLTTAESFLAKQVEVLGTKTPFRFTPDTLAVDEAGTLYLSSDRSKQILALDASTGNYKYSFEIITDGSMEIVGIEGDTVWVFPARKDKVYQYKEGKLLSEREPTDRDERAINRKKFKTKEGDVYKIKNTCGFKYIKEAKAAAGTSRNIMFTSRTALIVSTLLYMLKFLAGGVCFALFFSFVFQLKMKEEIGEDRFYSIKEYFTLKP